MSIVVSRDGPATVVSIDRPERVQAMARAGCAGFTVGTAALDGAFRGAPPDLPGQLRGILAAAACFG